MIYRFTQKNTSEDTLLKMMEAGIKLDFDKLWVDEKAASELANRVPETVYHNKYTTREDIFPNILLGVFTFGIFPLCDTVFFGIQKIQKKVLDKMDVENDIITVSADEIFVFEDRIKAKVSELAKLGHKVSIVVDGCAQSKEIRGDQRIEYDFDINKLLKLWDLNDELKKLGMAESIKFNEFFQTKTYSDLKACWNLEQVIDANMEIDKVVRKIRDLKLSPYETMVYIHKYITQNYGYGFNGGIIADIKGTRKSEKNRSIVAAILNKKTVCAGYASLTKVIIDRLNIPGLTCEYQNASCWKSAKKDNIKFAGGHALVLVSIEDSKYNISGSYLNDATWDSKTIKCPRGRGYTYFMYPVTDMTKLKGVALSARSGTRARLYGLSTAGHLPTKGVNSDPIPYGVFEKAVKNVYSLESDFCQDNDSDKTATEDILRSLRRARNSRIDDANPLVKQAGVVYKVSPIYQKSMKLKKVKYTLKSQAINSDMEMSR